MVTFVRHAFICNHHIDLNMNKNKKKKEENVTIEFVINETYVCNTVF